MNFRNTACLATLLLSIPLVASDAYGADEYIKEATEAGNTNEFTSGEYSKVVMGEAINKTDASLTELKANNNKATFNSGVTLQAEIRGGQAQYEITSTASAVTVQANNNTLTFKSGSNLKRADQAYIYAGNASIDPQKTAVVNGTFEANGNTITIEKGAIFDGSTGTETGAITIVAGSTNSEKIGNGNLFSQSNTLTMDGSAFTGTADKPIAFRNIKAGTAGANTGNATSGASEKGKTDQGNTLTITNLSNASIETVAVAQASSVKGGKWETATEGGIATTRHNKGQVQFGDNVKITDLYGVSARGGSAVAADNSMSVSGGEIESAYGAYTQAIKENATAAATDNTLTVSGAKATLEYAAYADASKGSALVSGNTLTVSDGEADLLSGGFATGLTAKAEGNKGTVSNTNAEEFSGGMAIANGDGGKAEASSNSFEVKGGKLATVYGGMTAASGSGSTATAEGNKLTLTDAEVTKNLYGGNAYSSKSDATASGNTLSLNGGSYSGNIYGGYAEATNGKAQALNNTVELNKSGDTSPVFADTAVLYGGFASTSTGNSLKFNNVQDMTAGNIKNFQALAYTYDELHAGDVILTLKDTKGTDISKATVNVSVSKLSGKADNSEFSVGDKVYLLQNESGLTASGTVLNTPVISSAKEGMYESYALELQTTAKALILTRTEGTGLTVNNVKEQTVARIPHYKQFTYTYKELRSGDVILTVTDANGSDISDASVNVTVDKLLGADGGEFKIGDKVYLLRNVNGLNTSGLHLNAPNLTAQQGISLEYYLELQTAQDESGKDIELILTRTDGRDPVLPGTKAIAEGAASGLALVNESSNAAIELLRDFSMASGTIAPFVHVQASSMTHETGSSINVSAVSLVAGLGTGLDTGAGNLSLGAFF